MDEKMTNSEEDFPVIVSSLPAVGIPTSYPTCFLEAIATLETSVKMKPASSISNAPATA